MWLLRCWLRRWNSCKQTRCLYYTIILLTLNITYTLDDLAPHSSKHPKRKRNRLKEKENLWRWIHRIPVRHHRTTNRARAQAIIITMCSNMSNEHTFRMGQRTKFKINGQIMNDGQVNKASEKTSHLNSNVCTLFRELSDSFRAWPLWFRFCFCFHFRLESQTMKSTVWVVKCFDLMINGD